MTEPRHEAQHTASPRPPASPTPPTPASVNAAVPIETWRRELEHVKETPSNHRHELLSTLLDDLDSQVSSL